MCVFVAAGPMRANNVALALQNGLQGHKALLLVSALHCPITPVLVHQPERNATLASAVNDSPPPPLKAHTSASSLKKTPLDKKIRSVTARRRVGVYEHVCMRQSEIHSFLTPKSPPFLLITGTGPYLGDTDRLQL